jgi:hypothetical protein
MVASIGMAVSTFVGATTGAISRWLLVPVVTVWAYVTGLTVALGPRWRAIVLTWAMALVFAIAVPLAPLDALLRQDRARPVHPDRG